MIPAKPRRVPRKRIAIAIAAFGVDSGAQAPPDPPEATSPPAVAPSQNDGAPPDSPELAPPRVLTRVVPEYPEAAIEEGLSGGVQLNVTVGIDGSVSQAVVHQGISPVLDAAALSAVRRWTFAPATRSGKPLTATVRVELVFEAPARNPAAAASQPGPTATASPGADSTGSAGSAGSAGSTGSAGSAVGSPVSGSGASAPALAPSEVDSRPSNDPPATPNHSAETTASTNVTVSGERTRRASTRSASDYTVDRDVVEAAPRHEGVDVLRTAPGMFIERSAGTAVAHRYMLRGFDSEHGQDIEFRVAEMPINLPAHIHGQGYADLGFLIAETVDEVRATEGVHDPRQGDFAVAGTIDIKLGVRDRGIQLKSAIGSFNTFRQLLLWAPKSQLRDSFGAASYTRGDGFGENRRNEALSAVVQQGFGLEEWRTRVTGIFRGARANAAGVLRRDDIDSGAVDFYDVYPFPTARAQNALAQTAMVGVSSDYNGFEGDSGRVGLWLRTDTFRFQQNFTGFLEVSNTLVGESGRGDLIEQRNQTRSVGVSANYRTTAYQLGQGVEGFFEVGSSARFDEVDQQQNLLDAQVRLQTWDERVDASIRGMNVGVFADLDLHLTQWLKLRAGVRADALSYEIADHLGNAAAATRPQDSFIIGFRRSAMGVAAGPRTSLDVQATDWLTVHASYGEGFRSPQARTLDDGEQTPFAKVRSVDLGARFEFDDEYEVSVAAYRTDLSDDVAFEAREGRLERVGETRRLGAVLHAVLRPLEGLVAAASVTYVDAELLEPPLATADDPQPPFTSGQNLPFVPPMVARLDAGYEFVVREGVAGSDLGARVGLGFSGLSSRPLPFGDFADPVALLDLSAGLSWGVIGLGVEVFNVLDSEYSAVEYSFVSDWDPDVPGSALPERHLAAGPPRTVMGTLELAL